MNVNSNITGLGSLIISNSGTGQVKLFGSNTFAGGVTMSNGTLSLGHAWALGTGSLTIATSGAILDNASTTALSLTTTNQQAWNSSFTFTGTGNLTMGPGTVTLGTNVTVTTSAKVFTVPGAIAGAYALVKDGAGTLVLTNGGNNFSSLTVNNGTNQLGSGGAGVNVLGSAIVTNNGVLTFNFGSTGSALYSNQISGTGSLNLQNTSIIYLSGSNSYSGGTYLSSGTSRLAAGNDNALGGGALYFINSGSELSATGKATRTLANSLVFSNNATLGNGTDSGLLNLTGNVNLASAWRQLTISSEVNMAGVVSNGGFTKLGSSTLTLSGANVFGSGLSNAAGTLVIGNDSALGTGLLTFSGGSLSNTGNHVVANDVNLGSSARISVASGESLTLGGVITNAGGLVKIAGGTLSLNGNNSYAGATLVSNGTLRVNGVSSGTGGLTVYSNATLGGTGSLRGVTIADGGWLAPGNSIGTLTVSNLTLSSGSLLSFELAATNASDQVVDLGTLTLAQMSFSNFAFSTNAGFGIGTYTLINAALHNGIFNPVTNESF
ncbi:MAG: autotransporter-associated beta strand repeat-containing protein, partial [Verrucomicrobiia bacterium]